MSRRLALAVLVVSLLVAGCGGDPEPQIAPTPSTSPTSASPTESEDGSSAETPRSFIDRWFATADAMLGSGETEDFEALNADCSPCDEYARTVREIYSRGGSILAEPTLIKSMRKVGRDGDLVAFDIVVGAQPSSIKRTSVAEPETFPGGRVSYRVTLVNSPAMWVMQNYVIRNQDLPS